MVTISEIAASLGDDLLKAVIPTDAQLSDVVMVEPDDDPRPLAGALVLAPGGSAADAADLVVFAQRIAAQGAAGLVIKPRSLRGDGLSALSGAAQSAGLALFLAADSVPWHQLIGLLETARQATESASGAVALGDLFGLANAVAALTGGATSVEDPSRRVLAYSTIPGQQIDEIRQEGILGRQVPDVRDNDASYRKVYRASGVTRIQTPDGFPRLAVAVRSGSEVLGSLWVIDAGGLSADAEAALLDSGRLAALHLLRARTGADLERRARGEALRGLLDGRASAAIVADRIGVSAAGDHLLIAVAILTEQHAVDELLLERLHELVALRCAAVSPGAVTAMAGDAVWALLPAWGDADPATLVAGISERVQSALGATAIIAIGETGEPLAGIAERRVELGHVLRVLARPDASMTVARRRDVHAALVLIEVTQTLAVNPRLQLDAVAGMLEHDRTQGGRYVETLLAYFDCLADIPAAAERVSVHPNTFRYRLRRVREVFGVDLENPDERLVLWLQLKALSQT